jgi:hypothetical protein
MITAKFDTTLVVYKKKTPKRQYYLVLPDDQWDPVFERTGLNRLTGAPCVFRGEPYGWTYFNAGWQKMFFEVNRTNRGFNEDHKDFITMAESSKSHFNSRGLWNLKSNPAKQTAYDYIIGEGPVDANKNKIEAKYSKLLLGGNVVCGIKTVMPFKSGHIEKNEPVLQLMTLKKPVSGLSYATHPHLIHAGTIIIDRPAPEPYEGGWIRNPYPDKNGRNSGLHAFYPLVSEEPLYYPMKGLRELDPDEEIPNVCNPPMTSIL